MIVAIVLAGISSGQNVNISGLVVDPSRSVVPTATVTLTLNGAVIAATQTDQTGRFTVRAVPPKRYEMSVEMRGFPSTVKTIDVSNGLDSDIGTVELRSPGCIYVVEVRALPDITNADPGASKIPLITLCDLMTDPERFNGAMITVRQRIEMAFEHFGLSVDGCTDHRIGGIWLEYGRGPKKQPTIWCCGDTTPSDRQIVLNQDDHFRRFHRYLTARRKTKDRDGGHSYLYEVSATLTGRFDAVPTKTCSVGKSLCPKNGGFGHFGSFPARLVIQSVSDVTAEPIDRSH